MEIAAYLKRRVVAFKHMEVRYYGLLSGHSHLEEYSTDGTQMHGKSEHFMRYIMLEFVLDLRVRVMPSRKKTWTRFFHFFLTE